jgi:AcrR family transcriptional regulator
MTKKLIPRVKRVRRDSVEDQQRLREQILEAAGDIFRREGLHGLTMRAVASAVDVSAMALYRYYADKSELVHGLWDFVMKDVQQEVSQAVAAQPTALGKLRASTESAIAYWESHPDHFHLVFMTEQTMGPRRAPGITDLPSYILVVELSRKLIEALADEVGGDRSRVLLARDLRLAMIVGYLHARLINHRYPWGNLDALRAQVVDSVVESVVSCLREGQPSAAGVRRRSAG